MYYYYNVKRYIFWWCLRTVMKSKTYSNLSQILADSRPYLGKLGEIAVAYGLEWGTKFLEQRKQRQELKEQFKNDYYCLTGKGVDDALEQFISSSVDMGWDLYLDNGTKRAYSFAINQLEKAKTNFNLEQKVIDYIDGKLEDLKKKI